jgi:predicted GTPase
MTTKRAVILGAAGRDFHDFLTALRDDPSVEVVAFTAAQIPGIADRTFPPELSGPRYPDGLRIVPERELEALVRAERVDEVILSYSDLAHVDVMHLASRALAVGASFRLLSPRQTVLRSRRPVVALTAVRTGCGKSQAARYVVRALQTRGVRTAVLRHPMPYGDLRAQRVQRFASVADLDAARVTVEEREDYEPHVLAGSVVFAGVDYAAILAEAEREADVIVWDGGNNDLPFVAPDLWITVVDPHRAGHELTYHPGETNLRSAHVVLVNKIDTAPPGAVDALCASVRAVNPDADVVLARSEVTADAPERIRGRRVLVIEDGPTLTHGQMAWGAGKVAAERHGAAAIVDPRPHAVGSIRETFERYPHLGPCLPAVGYSDAQVRDLEATVAGTDAETVVIATPADLGHVLRLDRPSTRVRYELADGGALAAHVHALLDAREG